MKNRLHKRLSAWLLTLVMLVGMLPAMASADEVGEDLAPPAPQEENYGYVRLVFAEGEQLDLCHGEYITECSPTAEILSGADEDFIFNGEYAALYYEGKLYCKATLDGVSINADAVLPAEAFALVPMGEAPTTLSEEREDETPPAVEVVEPEDGNSGTDETVEPPPSTEPAPPALPESKEEDKTTEDEGGSSGSDYDIKDDTQPRGLPRGLMKVPPALTATGNYPDAGAVSVDGGKKFGLPRKLYFKNGGSDCTEDPTGFNACYDPNTGTLTLRDYNGKGITVGGANRRDITIVLIGTNKINNGRLESNMGGDITVTSSSGGTLSIYAPDDNSAVWGIVTGYGNYNTGSVTITGDAHVDIDVTINSSDKVAYGIYAKKNITISENASVGIICATPNNDSYACKCYGLFTNNEKVTIDTEGTISIDVKKAGSSKAHSYGVRTAKAPTLTKVGGMTVEWQKNGADGAAISGANSFSAETHAVNVDTTNCYASYRLGTPRTVTVNNGTLTGPGVTYAKGSGNFLAGDKVDLIAPDRQVSATDITLIPFVKWTSADVSVTNPTSQSEAYITVPNKDAKVQAHYKAFTVQPSFTRTDSNKGTVSCTLISTEHSSFPKICRADTLGEVSSSFMSVDETTTYESKVYKNYNPPGEYVVKVAYNKVTYYSEPFMIDYSERAASVSPVTISGETGQTIIPADVTVTLQDCTFNTSLGGTGSWITNLPAGLTQSVMRVGDNEAKITVSGTPKANCVEQIKVTVPKAAISDDISDLTAPSYESANFDIKTTLTTAAATIQPPVAGQHPNMNPVSADPSKYTVDFENWSVGSSAMSATDTFEADKWYYCYLTFTPQPGYAFASGSGMTYTINGDDAQTAGPWVRLAMKALPSAISLDVSGTVDLGNKKLYDPVPVKNIKVTNHLSSEISNIPITLSDPTNFRVLPKSIKSIPANGTGTFQVAPAPNLSVGYYSTTVTVGGGSSGIIEQSFTVEFSVCEVIMLTAKHLTYNGEWQTGVTASVAGVTIEGNSRRDAGNYTATAYLKSGYYMWPDYTTDSTKDISWSIGKRTPQSTDIVVTPPTNPVYDGNRKDATAKLDSKYTGAGAITISKYVNPDTGEEVQPISAGTYTVYVNVAGGSNFNHAINLTNALSSNWTFTIYKAGQDAPVGLGASAPTSSSGKGKINGTAANMQYTKTPDVPTSWSDCTEGSTMVNPGTYYVRYKGDNNHDASPNVKVIVPEYGAGVTVSGAIKSYGSASEAVTVTLLQGTIVIGSPQVLTGASGSVPYSQSYAFSAVPAGEYTLKVEKKGHAPWTESITVDSTAIAKDVTVYLWGDVNLSGDVTSADATVILRHVAGIETLTTPMSLNVGDVDRSGDLTAADATKILRFVAGIDSEL